MPFDSRVNLALDQLARPIAEFRAAIVGALAQGESYLAAQEPDEAARHERARVELGRFAEGRLDAAGFATLTADRVVISAPHRERLQRAIDVLRDVLARGSSLHVVDVPSGATLVPAVEGALARAGRAFGAVLTIDLIRGGAYRPEAHDSLLDQLAFRAWTRAERRFAPPLVVSVDGGDLHIGGLADYLDGREKIVLVVRGDAPPAPLARLITPGTMVLQTADPAVLERVASSASTAIAALVPPSAAQFLHDPALGMESWKRLAVWHMPAAPTKALGGISAWQMSEDLRHLSSLVSGPTASGAAHATAAVTPDSVDALARWLLGQSELHGLA